MEKLIKIKDIDVYINHNSILEVCLNNDYDTYAAKFLLDGIVEFNKKSRQLDKAKKWFRKLNSRKIDKLELEIKSLERSIELRKKIKNKCGVIIMTGGMRTYRETYDNQELALKRIEEINAIIERN